jgi:Dockerin type I domain
VNPPTLVTLSSRKVHGSAGVFDLNLPLTAPYGVEPRSGGANGQFLLDFHFSNPILSCGTVSSGAGTATIDPASGGNDCLVDLTGVSNAQYVTVTLAGVLDNLGNQGNVPGTFGVLLGDVNGSKRVDAADVSSVRQQTLQPVTSSNFLNDLNTSGRIDAADVSIARQQTLTSLP